jgi:hypothetical protein
MSKVIEELQAKIAANQKDFEALHEGSSNSVDSFNLLLDEMFNPKLMKVFLTGTQEIQDTRLILHTSLIWASPAIPATPNSPADPGGWKNNKAGTIIREYPLPPAEEVTVWINDWLNEQLNNRYSPLVVALSHISNMYAQHTRKKLLER